MNLSPNVNVYNLHVVNGYRINYFEFSQIDPTMAQTICCDNEKIPKENTLCQENLSEQTVELLGEHETQVSENGEADLNRLRVDCTKNPGHTNFIPAEAFTLQHLPEVLGFCSIVIVVCGVWSIMASTVDRNVVKLPSLTSQNTKFIRPRKLTPDEPPLKLNIVQGSRQFPVCLRLGENENGDRISMRHLAEAITCETGLRPCDQKYYYKNLSWENPDMGPWSPALRDMGLKNGDKVHLVNFQHSYPDWKEISTLDDIEKENSACTKELHMLFYKLHGINESFVDGCNQTVAFNLLKENFDKLKSKFLEQIQVLNSIVFDHRNAVGQARRRKLLDHIQRQIDQCTEISSTIFHKFAQANYLANVGRIYPRDLGTRPAFNKWGI
ncbi:hypothetical protein Btru_073574 [Bulinus truncatus]|nr:hypothetical protein Btru_073574 [Bulinus truncatus]